MILKPNKKIKTKDWHCKRCGKIYGVLYYFKFKHEWVCEQCSILLDNENVN